ncbi:hydrocephalus-inducing protein homolog [Varanus komodoensis]|uniref:hydrocephalus-inducing protein homolog n=1 Tax=Varanus komodoensis TaxID=61221 RepID=UPI001CF7D4DA|nr:hydrocephalus-inducing protein homolog [Varanus komodoensis]
MLTDRAQKSLGPCKLPGGFQSKVVAPRNPKLVKEEKKKDALLTPSAFLKEMSLTTEQKMASTHEVHLPRIVQLLDMSETSHQKFSSVDLDQSLFQPFPSEVIFQNYTPCELYEVPLILRNNDKIPRLVKVVLESSPYFRVVSPNDVCNKVAPGMPSTFRILFTPEENKDYFHEVTCITEREKFIVPIRAIGARGILDFPDQLNFSTCPVKYSTEKTLLVRNIGNREARYQITTQRPFSVEPSIGTLGVQETEQFTVEFRPEKTGSHSGDFLVHYDTGEDIHVSLYGAATDVNVRLDKNSLTVEKTFITLANQRLVVIHNRSDIIAHFQWKVFATQEEEEQKKHSLCHTLQAEEEGVLDQLLLECPMNPALREHLSIVTRTFQNRLAMVREDSMLFSNNIFTIEPLEGDVWPNSTTEISVIFRPQEAGVYQRTVYCDISGRETRLPLRIKGEAMAPKLSFNFDQLDVGKIFVGSVHSYEAILSNQGAIDALFDLMWPSTALGSCFNFQPSEGIVEPGSHQAIQITFSSTILGHFLEEFKFSVNGSPQPVTLVIRGCVIGPTFHFNVPSLSFGDVSFGFPRTLSCCLSNTSLVPMTFSLRVPGDGTGEPSVSSQSQASDISRPSWRKASCGHARLREFTITPSHGTIRSQGLMDIQVTLCPNTVKTYETALVVDVKGSGEDVLALPIAARCVCPALRVANPVVNFGRCFLKFPYQQMARLVNDSDLPGCYGVLPQERGKLPAVLHSSPAPCGIIEPRSSIEIPLTLEVQERGSQEAVAYIAVFGNQDSPLMIRLVTIGEGPVVYVYPDKLNFGCTEVLKDSSRLLYLSNQSVIPAPFDAQMAHAQSLWRLVPSKGVVPPEAEISLTLIAHLDDTVLFQDDVILEIENSNSYIIPVQATGTGTTIVTDKPFAPAIDLGPHFSLDPCCYRFRITNCGRRAHQLYWMTEGFPAFRPRNALPATGTSRKRKAETPVPVFQLQPLRMELTPGKSMDMFLEGSSDIPKVVKERLVCHAIIGKQSGKECIMKVDVTCEFIAPVLQISSRKITFCVQKNPSDVLTAQYEPLTLKNVSSLPLNIILTLQEPFALYNREQSPVPRDTQPLTMDVGEIHHLYIRFDPLYRDDLYSRVAEEVLTIRYLEHPQVDHIHLCGEVHFPNLHFQTMDLNFGCILNDTEIVKDISMTNCSPLLVKYRWSFLTDDHESFIRVSPREAKHPTELDTAKEQELVQPPQAPTDGRKYSSALPAGGEAEEELPKMTQAVTKEVLWGVEPEEHQLRGVEEVFDIMPLYGALQPSETQPVSFTFYGHADMVARVKALCEVEGGPTYGILLSGEASLVSYAFNKTEIDYGLQPFDQICMAEITLRNTGKVRFEYSVLNSVLLAAENPPPGVPLTRPAASHIESGKEQVLKVYYLPGIPEVFQRTFQIQVAHLEPDSITLKGEGIFPRICLDLPRNLKGNERYSTLLREVKERMEQESQKDSTSNSEAVATEPFVDESVTAFDTQLLMELERLLVQEHALEQQKLLGFESTEDSGASQRALRKLVKAQLPEYILDFGYIILGTIRTHVIKVTNTSPFPVSFHADKRPLWDTGFNTELDRVKNLPFCQTQTFEVWFDPQSANQPLGEVDVLLPIKVVAGPTFHISLRATVIMPSLCISNNDLEFSAVQCGQCQVQTVQLHNQLQVSCEWMATSNEQMEKVDKRMPAALRRKMHHELKSKPHVFEMIPPYGILAPGERLNVQVKFAPREEKFYRNYLILSISQSTQQLLLNVSGQGLEPRLEFSPAILELGPLLPYAIGDEAEVVVKNPCCFPIEFYSLEFDQQYLLEERILRMLKGYDSHNILLLPPRVPGEKLPPEVLEYYEEQKKSQGDQETLNQETEEEETMHVSEPGIKPHLSSTVQTTSTTVSILPSLSLHDDNRGSRVESKFEEEEEEEEEGTDKGQPQTGSQQSLTKHQEAVGELDNNPVSKAIARHLGIDISPEGRAARNRRGIAVIIHGAPLTGKTSAAVALAKHYSAACLSIDLVVLEAISDGSSSAGLRARELCIRAAIEQAQRETEEGGAEGQPALALGARLSAEALGKHASDGSQQSSESKTGPLSAVSRGYRGSSVTAKGKSEGHASQKQQLHQQPDPAGSQVPSSPIPSAPIQRRLSLSASVAGDYGLMSCVLPEELLVEILSDRMQLSDCYRGMVFDGLETLFARSPVSALLCLLKAINNRRYIYFVNLCQDFIAMKAREKSKQVQEEREKQETIAREKARLQEVDEEAYDALTEEQKIQFDSELLQALRERKKRELEKLARELEEKKHQQELERLREEEEMKKKSKRYRREAGKEKEDPVGKKGQPAGKQVRPKGSRSRGNPPISAFRSDGRLNEGIERKPSAKERPDVGVNDKDEKKKRYRMVLPNEQGAALPPPQEEEEVDKEVLSENEKALAQRFKLYEATQKDIVQLLMFWDRVQLAQLQPPGSEEKPEEVEDQRQAPSGRKGRKDRERERQERLEKERAEKERAEKERVERERLERLKALEDSRATGQEGEGGEGGEKDVGVPYLEIQVLSSEDSSGKRILESGKLPDVMQILNGLGLGPSGPPIPPTAFFSVIPYPEKRSAPVPGEALKHFTFLAPEELNLDDEKKDADAGAEMGASPPVAKVEEQTTPTRGKLRKEKSELIRDALREKKATARGRKGPHPSPGTMTALSELDQGGLTGEPSSEKLLRLSCFRWIVPANGEVSMRLHFSSTRTGLFDQVLNFEIMGTRRQYQVYCRGTCTYPTICQDPMIVFPHRKKSIKPDEIIFKKYIMSLGLFHFGPLLCGKSREKYKAARYPNHFEKITIFNTSPLEAEVHFFFKHDSKAVTYLLDPPSLTLKPSERQVLTVWAYPTASGIFEDSIVCCIKENPEPVVFRICCQGVRPELDLDRRQLHFEKLLLHRKETKSLYLKNFTPLPVAWRVSGLENLGDDFSVSEDMGLIEPFSEYCLLVHFKATKALNIKKAIRLEVSDAENILGIVQIETIQIIAEAYDVALDISFPRGTNGTLEFGTVKVMDEAKQSLSMKNKGKYEIAYSLVVESTDHMMPSLSTLFSIHPQKGNLGASDRPTPVQIIFRSKREVKVDDKPILHCHVIEPSVCEGGEIIATIPIRVSVQAMFAKYSITPPSLINFGPLVIGSRKTNSFTIENKGALDFKFGLCKVVRDVPIPLRRGNSHVKSSRSREADLSRPNALLTVGRQSKRADSLQKDTSLMAQARFSLGMFTVSPGFGTVAPGGHQVITVDCLADPAGKCEEYMIIEITDRDPEDNPGGIPYALVAEACIPGFVTDHLGTIFEEHRICNSSSLGQVLKAAGCEGVFVADENKFLFNDVLVGHQTTARFKIFNTGRIPCDVVFTVKPVSAKATVRVSDIFEVHPVRMCITSRSHAFATLTFSPQSMQNYQCVFEASVDAMPSVAAKTRSLSFEVTGDGNLPRITVVRPVLRNKKGSPLLLFRRLLVGHTETLPLVLKNSGSVLAQLYLDVSDENGAFTLKPRPSTQCIYVSAQNEDSESSEGVRKPHTVSLALHNGESAEFDVIFQPSLTQHMEGLIHLSITDNQYEETSIQMVGEGYQTDVTLDNIHSLLTQSDLESAEGCLEDSAGEAARMDCVQFRDCHIGTPYQATFTITNHSKSGVMRFEWPALGPCHFSPQVGHLHAGCTKNIMLTLKSSVPVTLNEQLVKCKVTRIAFPLPVDQVPDWDDRLHTVKWVDAPKSSTATRPTKRKVIEIDPEPAHVTLEEGGRELELRVSATVDYAQYKMEVDTVHFKDTLLFQARVFRVELSNTGNVRLEYAWRAVMEESGRAVNFAADPLPSNPEGEHPSATSAASVKAQSSRPLSQLESGIESFHSYVTSPPWPPFSVEPRSGVIPPGESQSLEVKFCPQELGEFEGRLLGSISNLQPEAGGPVVAVKGKSLLPYCHFDLEDSDYITAKRRDPDWRGPSGMSLDPNTKVIEFSSVGVRIRNTRSFAILNPTNTPYTFQWSCDQQEEGQEQPAFICFTERGQLRPEKSVEVIFEFIPRHLGITESFWSFTIPEHNICVPFLLVGHTTDPAVSLDRPHLNFRSLLVGHEVSDSIDIINDEKEAYSFAFRESSRFSEGRINCLKLQPMEGSIPAHSRLPISISFMPTLEGEVNFNLICDVKKKSQPLCLNVKATGHAMNVSVKCKQRNGTLVELDPDQANQLPFHEMQVNDHAQCHFYILNSGKFNFTFSWEFHNAKRLQSYFSLSPNTGTVEPGERAEVVLSFHPLKACTLKGDLKLQISHGPVFTCELQGSVVTPSIHFSFTKVDFGNCFIYQVGMPISRRILTITNKDEKQISLECLFTSTTHLETGFHAKVLSPGGKADIPISFYPRETILYHDIITFEINGLLQRNVEVFGKGIELKIDVVEPRNRVLKFGAVPSGHVVKKTATIVNNSVASVTFSLSFVSSMPELQETKVLTLSPSSEVTLSAKGGTCHVEVAFGPRSRLLPFTEEVLLSCQGTLRTLLAVQGSCQGIEVSLDQDHVPFGAVVLRSQASRRITLQNTGDVGVGFKWDAKSFQPDFSIKPVEGYVSPGMDVSFEVTFHPCEQSQDICYENLQCQIQGREPLKLTLSGCCVGVPPVKEVVSFTCQVRTKQTQTIMLSNRTNQPWTLRPVIEGEQWKGPEFLRVESHQQNKPYEITYQPLAMNAESKKDQGSIFFPLPDGTGLLYLLQGTAEPPKSSGNIMREVPCKTAYTELFPISNWLNKPQRFRVTVDMLKPERLEATTTLKTLDYVEVPASAKKDHKLSFFSYKEGMYSAKVTFRNEATQEFLFYLITFKVVPCGPLGTIELVTAVRQSTSSSVKVENPLHYPVTFSTDCKVPDINLPPQFIVPAQSEGTIVFEFQPMRPGETGGRLALNSSELGSFQYDLALKATPARAEKALCFCTMLGSSQTMVTKFVNYTRQKTEYVTKIDCPDFHVDKVINAPAGSQAGTEVAVEVTFEPCQLGEAKGVLLLSSTIGGDYTIPLFGTCVPPKPQGPIQIRAGSSTIIPFKNVFMQPMAFTYLVENPAFTIRATETIRPKKSATITVSFEGNPSGSKAPVTSKLVVSCPRAAGLGSAVSWVFYLKGVMPEK